MVIKRSNISVLHQFQFNQSPLVSVVVCRYGLIRFRVKLFNGIDDKIRQKVNSFDNEILKA